MIVRKTGREQRLVELGHFGNADRVAAQPRAISFDGAEAFFAQRVVDDAENDFSFVLQRDRDRELRIGMGEVGCAVERIDDPAISAAGRHDRRFFFG